MTEYIDNVWPANGTVTTNNVVQCGVSGAANYGDFVLFFMARVSQNADPSVATIQEFSEYKGYGDNGGQWMPIGDVVDFGPLAPGTYYWRMWVTFTDGTNISGSPTAIRSFTVQDVAPTATQTSPTNGASLSWSDANPYPLTLQWTYSGGSARTAYQVVVERASDGLVIADSGKVVSQNLSHTANIPTTYRDVQLRWKVRVWNTYDTVSAYTGYRTVTLNTLPTVVTPVSPADNAVLPWSGSSPYPLSIQWTYSGTGAQSNYRIVVERVSDSLVVADSGVVSSSATSATIDIPLTYRDVPLRWRMTVSNVYGTTSAFSAYRSIKLQSPPTVTISTPTENQVLSSGTPSVTGTVATSSTVTQIVASLWNGTTKVWEKTVTGSYVNGASWSFSDPNFFLTPNITYTYRVEATDSLGTVSPTAIRNFSVQYTLPAAPGAVTVSATNYDTLGYVSVSWPDTGRDADFYSWEIEREDSLLDNNTGAVLSVAAWTKIGTVYVPAGSYEFRDYLAPAGHSVRYRVRQVALKFNTQVGGNYSTSSSVTLQTSSYWLIGGVNGATATVTTFRLGPVSDDSFNDVFESSEFNIIGRGRYSERGTYLGVTGQLVAKFRDNSDGTARQKRLNLNIFRKGASTCYLRNPFGDVFNVTTGDISVARIPGVGKAEFADVTIPYSQIGAAV